MTCKSLIEGRKIILLPILSRLDDIINNPTPINESFPGEYLTLIVFKDPWFADFTNFLVGKFLPNHLTRHQRGKFFNDLRHYFWDDPYLYHHGPNGMIRKCVPKHEMHDILKACHDNPYGEHHAGDLTAAEVLHSGLYFPNLIKYAHRYVKNCDACQHTGNIGKRIEMAMNYNLIIEPFDVWRMDNMVRFLPLMETLIFLLLLIMLLNGLKL
jgi:hypothetical protein